MKRPGRSSGPDSTRAPGMILADRYRIVRLLGFGAAGEVYAAHDLALGGEVALKVLNPSQVEPEKAIERFKREALLARRIAHPNVCRLHDFGVHREPNGEITLFLTMELLAGETLTQLIERRGRLSESEALEIARQLAAGLGAAHRAGVIHRDFKSSNVVLVPDGADFRAVITDFGLARALTSLGSLVTTLTQPGGVVGTPAYMAPEQVEGKPIDGRADIYALGVVLYEMLTGELPFDGESPISIAVKRVHESPRPIEMFRRDLSPRTRTLVERCMERDPENRFSSAEEIVAILGGASRIPRGTRRWRAWLLAGVGGAVVGAGLWLAVTRWGGGAERPMRVAFASLQILSPQREDWMGEVLAQLLTSELNVSGVLETVPAELVAAAHQELQLEGRSGLEQPQFERLRSLLGADILLGGTVIWIPTDGSAKLRLTLRPLATSRREMPTVTLEGSLEGLFELAAEAGRQVQVALGLKAESLGSPLDGRVTIRTVRDLEALRLFSSGVDALARGEILRAREQLETAVARDRDFALAWSALARAWRELGYETRSEELAQMAFQKSVGLPLADRLAIEGQLRRYQGRWQDALAVFGRLLELEPGDMDLILQLAEVEVEAGEAKKALERIRKVEASFPPHLRDLRLLFLEARVLGELTHFRDQLGVATLASKRAAELQAKRLEARADLERARALRRLGEPLESQKLLERVQKFAVEIQDANLEGQVLMTLADLERSQGNQGVAREYLHHAAERFDRLGNLGQVARVQYRLGVLEADIERPREALARYQEAIRLLEQIGDRSFLAAVKLNTASLLVILGEFEKAQISLLEARESFEKHGKTASVAFANQTLAVMFLWQAELGSADQLARNVVEASSRSGDRRLEGLSRSLLAEVALWRGDLATALEGAQKAYELLESAGYRSDARDTKFLALRVRFERGEREAVLEELRQLAEEFEAQGDRLDAVVFELARLLVRAGVGTPLIERVYEQARLGATNEGIFPAVASRLFLGEMARSRGDRAEAVRQALGALERARRSGARLFELEAELLLNRAKGDRPGIGRVRKRCQELELGLVELLARAEGEV